VIYSMTSSTPEDAPRGMEFLYNRFRFNVATSRARALCILVGSPALFTPECRTPKQMRMANGFCRYLELCLVRDDAKKVATPSVPSQADLFAAFP
jgi:superfamily I DNA and/or RNA helicase